MPHYFHDLDMNNIPLSPPNMEEARGQGAFMCEYVF